MCSSAGERKPLLEEARNVPRTEQPTYLSIFFAAICIIDQFGVNPIIILPGAVILCGWVGFPLALLAFLLEMYTALLLGRCWVIAEHLDGSMSSKRRYPYAALAEKAWGLSLGKIINAFIDIAVFGSNIPAVLVASQNLQFFAASVTGNTFSLSYCYWLIVLGVGLCPLTWLGSPKESKWISAISACLVLSTALITWSYMITDASKSVSYRAMPQLDWNAVGITVGILAFQFGCHPTLLTIQADMHAKTELPTAVLLGFLVTGSAATVTLTMASVLYGSGTRTNLIQGLPPTSLLYVGIVIVTLQQFLSTVVGGCSLYQDLEDKLDIPSELCWQRCCIRSALVMLTILAAEMLPKFDMVMGLLGGLFTGPVTFVMPPLLYKSFRRLLAERNRLHSHRQRESESGGLVRGERFGMGFRKYLLSLHVDLHEDDFNAAEYVIHASIVCIGLTVTAFATYFSVTGALDGSHSIPPCIVSVGTDSTETSKPSDFH